MTPSHFRFTLSELLLLTALCDLVMGMVTASRREAGRWYVQGLCFSPDGRFLVVDYGGERVRLWNVPSANPRAVELRLRGGARTSGVVLGFADSDTLVWQRRSYASGRATSDLLLWNVLENRLERSQAFASPWSEVCLGSVGESPVVVASSGSGLLEVWDLPEGRKRGTIQLPATGLWTNRLCVEGSTLTFCLNRASAGAPAPTLELWDLRTLQQVSSFPVKDYCYSLAISRDGRWLAARSRPWITIWDVLGASQPQYLPAEGFGNNLQFAPDARSLLVGRHDGSFEIWDIASRQKRGEVTPPAEIFLGGAGQAVLSPDGQTVAAARGSHVWLYDANTLEPTRTLGGSHRVAAGVLFSAGFIAWSALWGMLARRQRRRDELQGQSRPPTYRLPKSYDDARHPLRPLIGCLGWLFVVLALVILQRSWMGQSVWDSLIGAGFVAGVVFAVSLLVAVCRHWLRRRGGANLAKARRIAGQTLSQQRIVDGVTAYFFTDSPLAATVRDDFLAARQRFCELVGQPLELRRPLAILVFANSDQLDAYIDGRLGMAGLYWSVGAPQILLAERTAREQLLESRKLFRRLLANYFVEEYHRVQLPAGLVALVAWMLTSPATPTDLRRAHRRLRAGPSESGADGGVTENPLLIAAGEFAQLAVGRDQPLNYQRLQWLTWQFASLAEYLAGTQSGGRRERFGRFLRDAGSREPLEEVFSRHFAHGISQLLQDWRTWAAHQEVEPYDPVPPEFERYVMATVLPGIRDDSTPAQERVRLIRCLGGGGYVTGADELIRLLASAAPGDVRREVVWALESISGKRYGDDVEKWRQWWDGTKPHAVIAEVVPAPAIVPESSVAIADTTLPESARKVDPWASAVSAHATDTAAHPPLADAAPTRVPDAPPRGLKVCWNLLAVSGAVAILWSVLGTFVLPYHPAGVLSYAGLLAGVYAVTRGVGHAARGLRLAILGQELCFVTCNPFSPLLALAAATHLGDPLVKHYLEARQ